MNFISKCTRLVILIALSSVHVFRSCMKYTKKLEGVLKIQSDQEIAQIEYNFFVSVTKQSSYIS